MNTARSGFRPTVTALPIVASPDTSEVRNLLRQAGIAAHVSSWTSVDAKDMIQTGAGASVMVLHGGRAERAELLDVLLEAGYTIEEHGGTINVHLDRDHW